MLFFPFFCSYQVLQGIILNKKEVLYLIKNLSFEKRINLLERQLNELDTFEFDGHRHEKISIFESKTKQIFKKVLSDSEEYISDLERISFRPLVYFLDGETDYGLEYESFYDGVRQAKTLLKSAISNVEFEKELSDEEEPETIAPLPKVIGRDKTKVFIVHGHDENLKRDVALFIAEQGLEAVILHKQASGGKTIIEKLEDRSDVGFAIVLYTPCDIGRSASARKNNPRARQNVVFEHGFFVGKIGRGRVVALVKDGVEIPNDYSGVVYVSHNDNDNWKNEIGRELVEAGYKINFTKF